MNSEEFCNKLISVARNYKTLYVMGAFGAPLNDKNKKRYTTNHSYNKNSLRSSMIMEASSDTFAFDCVCLIKGILWGWCGDKTKTYGGATYRSNGVPDVGANGMLKLLKGTSTDFSTIVKGEAVWIDGHIGVYIGGGKVVECSPKFENKVQITNLGNLPNYKGGNYRVWTKHGKLPWIDYSTITVEKDVNSNHKTNEQIAREVIAGKWGNGAVRKSKLKSAGYDYTVIQKLVNTLLKK